MQRTPANAVRFAIAIHGGAGLWQDLTLERVSAIECALKESLRNGHDLLARGDSSLDAVERAIQVLEDSPHFSAGKGAACNAEGRHQLDASIMDGRDGSAGAVAAIGVAKNPISAARLVMTRSSHVLLTGQGADQFSKLNGAELVAPDYFWTEKKLDEWKSLQKARPFVETPDHCGTVGCVALDCAGNLAAGTSSGGMLGKMVGRVGDSAVIGAGTFADNQTCAVSCTGLGELFIRLAIAYDISARVRYAAHDLSQAVGYLISERLPAGTGGVIALDRRGTVVVRFNTRAMPHGIADNRGRFDIRVRGEQ